MAIGDISFEELKIGDMNLLADDTPIYIGVTIIEDILKPFGPSCEIKLLDAVDGAKENEVTAARFRLPLLPKFTNQPAFLVFNFYYI